MQLPKITEISYDAAFNLYNDHQEYNQIVQAYSALAEAFAKELFTAVTQDLDVNHKIQTVSKAGEPFAVSVFGETYRYVLEVKYSNGRYIGLVTCQVFDRLVDTYRSLGCFDLRSDGMTSIKLSGDGEALIFNPRGGCAFRLVLGVARAYMSGKFDS